MQVMHFPVTESQGPPLQGHCVHFDPSIVGEPKNPSSQL